TSHAYNHKKQRYRYYRCRASQEGLRCPTGLLNANDVEAAVVAPVKALAKSGALRDRILATLAEGDEGEVELVATKDRLEARITESAPRPSACSVPSAASTRADASSPSALASSNARRTRTAPVSRTSSRVSAPARRSAPRASTWPSCSTPSMRSGRRSCLR